MLKLPGSVCKLLFATFLVFLCFNDEQLVYAETLVLDKKHLNAIVEVPKVNPPKTTVDPLKTTVAPSSATVFKGTNPSTVTHSFDLKFNVGKASNYPAPGIPFKLTIGSACNLDILIIEVIKDKPSVYFNGVPVSELKSLTITNEKITTNSQPVVNLCDPQTAKSGGTIKFENPADDPSKFTVELTISGKATDVPGFKLTSSAQIYVPPTSSPNGNNGDESKNSTTISNGELYAGIFTATIIAVMFITLAVAPCVIVGTWLRDRKDEKNKDKTENKKGIKKKKRTITAEASED